jgi:hypothetical protein
MLNERMEAPELSARWRSLLNPSRGAGQINQPA